MDIIKTSNNVAINDSLIDTQVATAKQYPRDLQAVTNDATVMATLDPETAQMCKYAVPRGGDLITGPSVHLAKIIASNWGNMRIESRVTDTTDTHIVSEAVCFDLEKNVAVKVQVMRKITNKYGKKFNDDLITVTGNAANSIALRNAVFSVIPKAITDKIYRACETVIKQGSGNKTLSQRITGAINYFKTTHNISQAQIFDLFSVSKKSEMTDEHLSSLLAINQAIVDGDTTPQQAFALTVEDKKKQIKENKDSKDNAPRIDLP